MNESEFAKALIEYELNKEYQTIEWYPEVHYNHYGTRGCVDLVAVDKERAEFCLYELKSKSALADVSGANEILRQFNRHTEFFFKGTDEFPRRRYELLWFNLVFYATSETVSHLREYADMYQAVTKGGKECISVGVWHEETGFVPITMDKIWDEDCNAGKIREVVA